MAPSQTFEIRPTATSDIPAVTAIYRHYVLTHTSTFELEPPDEQEMADRAKQLLDVSLPYWVAVAEDAVVGFCYAAPYRSRPAYRFTVEDSVYVDPAHVGKGIGLALLSKVVTRCSEKGYREMIGVVGDSQNLASVRLHERLGFRPVGTLRNVGFKFDRFIDTVILQKPL